MKPLRSYRLLLHLERDHESVADLRPASRAAAPEKPHKPQLTDKDERDIQKKLSNILTDIENINESIFESIKHVNEQGQEYWTARKLQPVLEYKQWRQFSDVIDKAKAACDTSKIKVSDHFADVRKIVKATFAVKLLSYGIDPVDGFTERDRRRVWNPT